MPSDEILNNFSADITPHQLELKEAHHVVRLSTFQRRISHKPEMSIKTKGNQVQHVTKYNTKAG
jgi:hypothetical protein